MTDESGAKVPERIWAWWSPTLQGLWEENLSERERKRAGATEYVSLARAKEMAREALEEARLLEATDADVRLIALAPELAAGYRNQAAEIARLRAALGEAEMALKPFAEWAREYDDCRADGRMVESYFRAGHLRRARTVWAALATIRDAKGENDA